MQINIKETILGLTEAAINTLSPKEESERIANARAVICGACPFKKVNTCGKCGCYLPSVWKATYQKSCPDGRWFRASKIDNTDGLPVSIEQSIEHPIKSIESEVMSDDTVTEPINDLTDGKAE